MIEKLIDEPAVLTRYDRHYLAGIVDCGPSSDTVLVKFPRGEGVIFELAMPTNVARWLAASLVTTADYVDRK